MWKPKLDKACSLQTGEKKELLCKLSDRNSVFSMTSPEHVAFNKIGGFIKWLFLCCCRYIIKGEAILFFFLFFFLIVRILSFL